MMPFFRFCLAIIPTGRNFTLFRIHCNVDLILINPRVTAKFRCQNVITNPPVIAKSNQPKRKDLKASKSNVYYWLLLLWAMTTGAQLIDLDTLNYGGLGPHPRGGVGGGGGEGGCSYYEVNIIVPLGRKFSSEPLNHSCPNIQKPHKASDRRIAISPSHSENC